MSYEVDGRTVTTPVAVRDALAASATFLVRAEVVQAWLPEGLRARTALPGRALLVLTAVHYRDNDLGSYHELAVGIVVAGGVYIHRLPVDEEFSRAAGRLIWGFPKTVEELSVMREEDAVVCRWDDGGGNPLLRLAVTFRGRRRLRTTTQYAYSVVDGGLCRTRFWLRASGFGVRAGGARVELGAGVVADELRAAGLPKRPLLSMSMAQMQARFEAPEPAPLH